MCDTVVALGSATEEGFTFFGKNSDREPDEAQNILIVPRKKHKSNDTVQCAYLTIPQVTETARAIGAIVKNWGSKLDSLPSVSLGWSFSRYWRGYNKRNGII